MAVQWVIKPHGHFLGIEGQHFVDLMIKLRGGQFIGCQPTKHRIAEQIVHGRVQAIGRHQLLGIAPRFTEKQSVGFELLDARGELLPERSRYLVRHVQPPTVNAEFSDPVLPYLNKVFSRFGTVQIDFGHPFVMPHTIIVARILRHGIVVGEKPIAVLGLLTVLHKILKQREIVTAMVEHAVQQNLHIPLMYLIHQPAQIIFRTKGGVDLVVIHRIVLMIGRCVEDGREIEAGSTQLSNVIQSLNDALQVTAHEVLTVRWTAPRVGALGCQAAVSIAIPFGKDLIVDLSTKEVRRFIAVPLIGPEELEKIFVDGRLPERKPLGAQPHGLFLSLQCKAVARVGRNLLRLKGNAVVIVVSIAQAALHRDMELFIGRRFVTWPVYKGYLSEILPCGGYLNGQLVPRPRIGILRRRAMDNGRQIHELPPFYSFAVD